jgi:hypothetical protein
MDVVADRFEPSADGWTAHATLCIAGCEAPKRIVGRLDGSAGGDGVRIRVSGTARLDIRDVGIRAPALLVRRHVDITVTAELTR